MMGTESDESMAPSISRKPCSSKLQGVKIWQFFQRSKWSDCVFVYHLIEGRPPLLDKNLFRVWPDPWAGPALARPAAGHSCQTDQQDVSLRRTSSCLLRILRIVISGEVLSSQLASLPPLMERRQRQGKYNYWSECRTPEPAAAPRFTAGIRHQSLPRYGDHNPVTALLLLSWALGRSFCCKLRRTDDLRPSQACCCPLKWEESKPEFGAEARWDPPDASCARHCDYPESLWNAPFLIKETNIARCGPERDGG